MVMAARVRDDSTPCPSTPHRHDPVPQGGRCAFHAPERPGGICGRTPVAVYVNPSAKVHSTYRCRRHDLRVAVAAAAELGFVRYAIVPKAEKDARIAAMEAARG